ncbi:MAG: hypothetical protein ACI9KN_000674, partial [Gammaproteobacteria bacterium]
TDLKTPPCLWAIWAYTHTVEFSLCHKRRNIRFQ